jgi:hypothetical protein
LIQVRVLARSLSEHRSTCPYSCKADVGIQQRSTCPYNCEAVVGNRFRSNRSDAIFCIFPLTLHLFHHGSQRFFIPTFPEDLSRIVSQPQKKHGGSHPHPARGTLTKAPGPSAPRAATKSPRYSTPRKKPLKGPKTSHTIIVLPWLSIDKMGPLGIVSIIDRVSGNGASCQPMTAKLV